MHDVLLLLQLLSSFNSRVWDKVMLVFVCYLPLLAELGGCIGTGVN